MQFICSRELVLKCSSLAQLGCQVSNNSSRISNIDSYTNRTNRSSTSNEAPSDVNPTLDGSTYPGRKMCHFSQAIFFLVNQNASGYIWDQCCHQKSDGASFQQVPLFRDRDASF